MLHVNKISYSYDISDKIIMFALTFNLYKCKLCFDNFDRFLAEMLSCTYPTTEDRDYVLLHILKFMKLFEIPVCQEVVSILHEIYCNVDNIEIFKMCKGILNDDSRSARVSITILAGNHNQQFIVGNSLIIQTDLNGELIHNMDLM